MTLSPRWLLALAAGVAAVLVLLGVHLDAAKVLAVGLLCAAVGLVVP